LVVCAVGLALSACGSDDRISASNLTAISVTCQGSFYHEWTVTLAGSQAEVHTVEGFDPTRTQSPSQALTPQAAKDFRALLDSVDVWSWQDVPASSQLITPGMHCGATLASAHRSVDVYATGIPTSAWLTVYYAMSSLVRDYVGPLFNLDAGMMSTVTVKVLPPTAGDITVTDPAELAALATYFNGLSPGPAHDAEALAGSAYEIDISYLDGSTDQVSLVGNRYVTLNGGPAHDLPYDQASAFDVVMGRIRSAHR